MAHKQNFSCIFCHRMHSSHVINVVDSFTILILLYACLSYCKYVSLKFFSHFILIKDLQNPMSTISRLHTLSVWLLLMYINMLNHSFFKNANNSKYMESGYQISIQTWQPFILMKSTHLFCVITAIYVLSLIGIFFVLLLAASNRHFRIANKP